MDIDTLRAAVDEKNYIDVGDRFSDPAVLALRDEGYKLNLIRVRQLGTGRIATVKILTKPETTPVEIWNNRASISPAP